MKINGYILSCFLSRYKFVFLKDVSYKRVIKKFYTCIFFLQMMNLEVRVVLAMAMTFLDSVPV